MHTPYGLWPDYAILYLSSLRTRGWGGPLSFSFDSDPAESRSCPRNFPAPRLTSFCVRCCGCWAATRVQSQLKKLHLLNALLQGGIVDHCVSSFAEKHA